MKEVLGFILREVGKAVGEAIVNEVTNRKDGNSINSCSCKCPNRASRTRKTAQKTRKR